LRSVAAYFFQGRPIMSGNSSRTGAGTQTTAVRENENHLMPNERW